MVNFGARETVPAQYEDRTFHIHNPNVTLMRTTADENRAMGEWIGAKLNACQGPVRFLIPEKGVSLIDAPGMPFHDPDADAALFEALDRTVEQTPARRLIRLPLHINDADFAQAPRGELERDRRLIQTEGDRRCRASTAERYWTSFTA